MTLSEIVLKEIEHVYLNDGFRFVKSKKTFKKTDGKNELSVRYQFYSGVSIECTYGMSLAMVENVKKNAWGKLYKKDLSIVNERYNLPGNIDTESSFLLLDEYKNEVSEERVLEAIKYEKKMYLEYGKYFFEKYQDLNEIDKFYNVDNFIDDPRGTLVKSDDRFVTLSMISAAIVQNPNRFNIYERRREFIASRPLAKHYGTVEKYIDPLIAVLKAEYN